MWLCVTIAAGRRNGLRWRGRTKRRWSLVVNRTLPAFAAFTSAYRVFQLPNCIVKTAELNQDVPQFGQTLNSGSLRSANHRFAMICSGRDDRVGDPTFKTTGSAAALRLGAGYQENWILGRVLQVRWNRRACAGWSRKIQDVGVRGSIDDVDHTTIATGHIGTAAVTAGGHHDAEARPCCDTSSAQKAS